MRLDWRIAIARIPLYSRRDLSGGNHCRGFCGDLHESATARGTVRLGGARGFDLMVSMPVRCWLITAAMIVMQAAATAAPRLELGGSCDTGTLRANIVAELESDAFDEAGSGSIAVATQARDHRVFATITLDDGAGTGGSRVVEAGSCAELARAIALVIATAWTESAPPPVGDSTTHVASGETPSVEPVAVPDARASVVALLAGGGSTLARGSSRQHAVVGIEWRNARHSLGLELRVDMPEEHVITARAGVTIESAAALASACEHAGPVGLCALAMAGVLRGSSDGLSDRADATAPVLAGGLRATVEQPLSERLALRLGLGVQARATTTTFEVDHMPVWISPRFEGLAELAAILRFP